MAPTEQTTIQCACGNVAYEVVGPPIMSAACYCDDCQAGARQIEALPDAPPVMGRDGGTDYLLYRKDRVQCTKGHGLIRDYKLKETSPTRRVVATCCNSGMFLDFQKGHWLSVYRDRLVGSAPPLQFRIQTRFQPEGAAAIPDDVPTYKTYPLTFIGKLMVARLAMMIGR